jgi:N-acetylglucosamine-6-phosphate deacetylase
MRLRSERIITPEGTVAGEVLIEGGLFSRIDRVGGSLGTVGADDGVLDLGRRWLAPGYIDTHVHGGGGAQCNTSDPDEIAAVARFHAAHGTTALLATTVAAPVDDLCTALETIALCTGGRGEARDGAEVLGAHLEGPFLSRVRPGAMDPATFLEPDDRVFERLVNASGGCLWLMTVAPELPGALELIARLVGFRAIASVGHSDASYDQVRAAVAAGVRSATHTFNAMAPLHHREPGALGAVLDLPEVNCELICDGIHVSPAAMRLAYRAKGAGGIRLVTDAMVAAGMADGEYRLGTARVAVVDGQARLADGDSIAGSTLTMDEAVRGAVSWLGLSVEEAVGLASANPARLLGLADRKGSIKAGLDADLIVLDEDLRACGTIVRGEWVNGAPAGIEML